MTASMLAVPAALTAEGLRLYIVPQWRTNGHDGQITLTAADVWGTLLHHTADNSGLRSVWDPAGDIRADVPQPRCNLWVPRGGDYDVAVVSAGRAYHAGRNSSVALADFRAGRMNAATKDAAARGLEDDSNGNGNLIGVEVENLGDGQPLTDQQLRVLPRLCAAVCRTFGQSVGHIGHHRQATRRKPDMQWRGDIWAMTAALLANAPGEDGMASAEFEALDKKLDALAKSLGVVIYGDDRDEKPGTPDTHPFNLQALTRAQVGGLAELASIRAALTQQRPQDAGTIDYDEVQRRAEAAVDAVLTRGTDGA